MKASALSWFILIALSVVWGSSFILMKKGMLAFSSDEVAALRISIAFVFLLPFYFWYGKVNFRKNWRGLLIMGFFGNLIPAFLFTAAETRISSSLAGMLNALTPLFTILVAWLWFNNPFTRKQFFGILLGLLGAGFLFLQKNVHETTTGAIFALLVVAATLCYAISLNGIKQYLADVNSVTATLGAFTLTGPFAVLYLFIQTDFVTDMNNNPLFYSSLAYIVILAVVGSALSVIAYNRLIKDAGVVFASTCTYLIPVVAVFWGVLDGETVAVTQWIGIFMVILSIYQINRR